MKWIRYFILSAGAILLVAALTRFVAAAGQAQVLALPDPLLGIPLRVAVLLVGIFELVVALICLFGKRVGLQTGWLALLGINFLVFQICGVATHCHWQGTCIGSLTDPLQLTHGITGIIIGCLPIYLLLGSSTSSVWLWVAGRTANQLAKDTESIKTSCPACGVHIRFDRIRLGQRIDCPQCQNAVVLRQPENLKTACYFCHGHIEFPSHGIGEQLKCPHCKMEITLMEAACTPLRNKQLTNLYETT